VDCENHQNRARCLEGKGFVAIENDILGQPNTKRKVVSEAMVILMKNYDLWNNRQGTCIKKVQCSIDYAFI